MWLFGALTVFMLLALSTVAAYIRRDEIMANWSKYRDNPLYMFAAPMFKPEDDPRSRLGFAMDNFTAVITGIIMKMFAVFLQPVMKILQGMTGSITESANGIMNMRGVFTNMFKKFGSVTNIFQRRYNNTFQALRVTWTKLRESLNKTFGVTVSALYAGASTFRVIDNMFRLMTIVAIAILAILLGFVIFFFFILWPILPLIIIAIHFVAQTPYAGEVMGMEQSFCFAPNTPVITSTGIKPIQEIKLGDTLQHANGTQTKVTGNMAFSAEYEPLYELFGVQVSGAHIYYNEEGLPLFVKDHPAAKPLGNTAKAVYCLITSDHKIPVLSNKGPITFADWEEIESDDLDDWNKAVFSMLNPGAPYVAPSPQSLDSEAALSEHTKVHSPLGPVSIRNLHPGASVIDASGATVRVTGIVQLDASQVAAAAQMDDQTWVSTGTWVRSGTLWTHSHSPAIPPVETKWYMLFTESGTFRIHTNDFASYDVRDFSDVGSDAIQGTYDMVMAKLLTKLDTQK
jgi:hypothetical protein